MHFGTKAGGMSRRGCGCNQARRPVNVPRVPAEVFDCCTGVYRSMPARSMSSISLSERSMRWLKIVAYGSVSTAKPAGERSS